MNFYNHIVETIGNTPMVKLNKVVDTDALVLAKVESFNPGHSTKDRMALKMIEDAEKAGLLKEGVKMQAQLPALKQLLKNLHSKKVFIDKL